MIVLPKRGSAEGPTKLVATHLNDDEIFLFVIWIPTFVGIKKLLELLTIDLVPLLNVFLRCTPLSIAKLLWKKQRISTARGRKPAAPATNRTPAKASCPREAVLSRAGPTVNELPVARSSETPPPSPGRCHGTQAQPKTEDRLCTRHWPGNCVEKQASSYRAIRDEAASRAILQKHSLLRTISHPRRSSRIRDVWHPQRPPTNIRQGPQPSRALVPRKPGLWCKNPRYLSTHLTPSGLMCFERSVSSGRRHLPRML